MSAALCSRSSLFWLRWEDVRLQVPNTADPIRLFTLRSGSMIPPTAISLKTTYFSLRKVQVVDMVSVAGDAAAIETIPFDQGEPYRRHRDSGWCVVGGSNWSRSFRDLYADLLGTGSGARYRDDVQPR